MVQSYSSNRRAMLRVSLPPFPQPIDSTSLLAAPCSTTQQARPLLTCRKASPSRRSFVTQARSMPARASRGTSRKRACSHPPPPPAGLFYWRLGWGSPSSFFFVVATLVFFLLGEGRFSSEHLMGSKREHASHRETGIPRRKSLHSPRHGLSWGYGPRARPGTPRRPPRWPHDPRRSDTRTTVLLT